MNLSWNGVVALLGCLIAAILPLPKQAEGFRLGLFGAILAFVLVDSARRRAKARDHELVRPWRKRQSFSRPTRRQSAPTGCVAPAGFSIPPPTPRPRNGAASDTWLEAGTAEFLPQPDLSGVNSPIR